ncbi:CheY-like receiver, AAA-type ATPase, and DNA-binding domain-containing response regulator [Candidatus Kinetoplastibacterium desouzaii TCC079E]|uniref:CheY-like receiver, AAA-type ATPase, and DNA-binding domain-containing response regulator n=1 Tax=Candidatus Kinetoplastidibacterium desouzai TCC079E TaxID=1208919 RepID=M1M4R5_9PROT|nr:response regulator [Candidatus Kinetoplastibacterium desouzaii]AGF47190.1 CheY-like receiver, AAA-type ATPase, and DNA-binding domain-containing response regulator [Candidatus Kinetoplastibacterium desouzaii TCC079E]
MARILVVDDEIGIRELLSEILYNEGHAVEQAENAAQARSARLSYRPDLVLLDIWMPDTDGVSLLKEWISQGLLDMPVIMMSGHAGIDIAVEATRMGAMDFLEKPISPQLLLKTVAAGLLRNRAKQSTLKTSRIPVKESNDSSENSCWVDSCLVPIENNGGFKLGSVSLDQPLRDARDTFERVYFEYHLMKDGYSMTRVSERTGLERTHLYRKLKQLGITTTSRKKNNDNK